MSHPVASIVLVASAGQESIGRVMLALRDQTIAAQLEVVLCVQPEHVEDLQALPEAPFHTLRVARADFSTSAQARVSGVRASTADIVIFAEDHCFPLSNTWAERLVAPFEDGHAIVGPAVRNANPGSAASWANLAIEYGPWINATTAQERDQLPGHNSAYLRETLMSYDNSLGEMLEAEWVLHRDQRQRGATLWIEPAAEVEHLNFSRIGATMKLHLLEGWMFAASRAADWGLARRVAYGLGFPAIAAVRAWRITGLLWSAPISRWMALRSILVAWAYLLVSCFGEGIGYLFGDCGQRSALGQMEYERWKNLRPYERKLAFEGGA